MLVEHKPSKDEITPLPKTDDKYAFDEERLESMRVNMLDVGYTLEEAEDEIKQARAQQWRTYRLPETYPTLRIGQPPIDIEQRNIDRVEVWVTEKFNMDANTSEPIRWGQHYQEVISNIENSNNFVFSHGWNHTNSILDHKARKLHGMPDFTEYWQPKTTDMQSEEARSDSLGKEHIRIEGIFDETGNKQIICLTNTVQSTFDKAEIDQYVKAALEQNKNITKLEINITDDHVDLKSVDNLPFERIRRITGYLVGNMDKWNDAKSAEESQRVKHGLTQLGELDKKAAEAKVSSSTLNQNNNQIIGQMKGAHHGR